MVVLQAPTDYSFYQNENIIDFVYNQNGSRVSTLALVLLYDFIFKRQRTIKKVLHNYRNYSESRKFTKIEKVFHNQGSFPQ